MNAIVLLLPDSDFPESLSERYPTGLMPLGTHPVLRHIIEYLAQSGLMSVTIIITDHAHAYESYLGQGERFGINVNYALEREFVDVSTSLTRLSAIPETFLLIAGFVLTHADPNLLEEHLKATKSDLAWFQGQGDILMLRRDALTHMPAGLRSRHDLATYAENIAPASVTTHAAFQRIEDIPSYLHATREWLGGNPPFAPRSDSVSVGIKCRIHPTARLVPPVAISDHTTIGKNCLIGPYAVINEGCVIDDDAEIVQSIVWPETYVGSSQTLQSKLACHNLLVTLPEGTVVVVPDSFLLGAVNELTDTSTLDRLLCRFIAFVLLLLASPVLAMCLIRNTFRSARTFTFVLRAGKLIPQTLDGKQTVETLHLHHMSLCPTLSRLPELFDVVTGTLDLVGPEPLSINVAQQYIDTWAHPRFTVRPGFFHPWDELDMPMTDDDTKRVMENYYVATKSLMTDLRLTAKATLQCTRRWIRERLQGTTT
ncbi:sugar transferase [Desulfovibrio inopinatus]|uniref:sugar transferase n=1 Tax=Desulfovibrio inopinatus TaxID=102109 RepID=UPI0004168D69|nr:sugar transferase [Desulfovibrio inopinatus]